MSRVIVHVEALVLRGVRHEDRHAVSAGIQQELSRLLASPGADTRLAQLGDLHHAGAGEVAVVGSTRPEQIGIAAAKSVAGRLLP